MCGQQKFRSAWASAQSDKSSLSAWRKLGSLAAHWVHSEDCDQTGRMPRLICRRCPHTHFVGFVVFCQFFLPSKVSNDVSKERIYNGCLVRIENSITRVNCSATRVLMMQNSYPCDGIFNPNLATIKDSFSCIPFHRRLYLSFNVQYFTVFMLKYVHFRSRNVWFGCLMEISRMGENRWKPCRVCKNVSWMYQH